jgi:hypothetical protein
VQGAPSDPHGAAGYHCAARDAEGAALDKRAGPAQRGDAVQCFACGTRIELPGGARVGFRDECPRCRTDLHVCRNCARHDPGAHNQCREPAAEPVADRERANRCEWFAPAAGDDPGEGAGRADPRATARAAIDALFRKD